jgi:hypothetical protein
VVGVVEEVVRRLLGADRDERYPLVRRLEPDDLGPFGRPGLVGSRAFAVAALGLLLLLGCSRRRPEEPERAREKLAGHALNDSDDVPGILCTRERIDGGTVSPQLRAQLEDMDMRGGGLTGLDLVRHLLVVKKHHALALQVGQRRSKAARHSVLGLRETDLDLDVVLALVALALGGLADGTRVAKGSVLLLLALLVLLLLLGGPDLVDVEELDCDSVAVKRSVAVARARDLRCEVVCGRSALRR